MSTIEKAVDSIPFLDLVTPHLELEEELVTAFRKTLHSASFIGGAAVTDFEQAFAAFCNVEHAIAVGNGTDALRFALMAGGIASGDGVLTVPNTFIATTEAISQAGAHPEFIDIDERTCNISVEALRVYLEEGCVRDAAGRLLSRRSGRPVTAVLPVHLYGQMAEMDAISELAQRFGLIVIEDACQAHGAEYFSKNANGWRRAGSIGRAAAFSFYPGKNLGACGEGGAVTTNDEKLAQKVRMIRDHGQSRKYYHEIEGYNGRLDSIQCSVLSAKLPHLNGWNERRRECAAEYNHLLANIEGLILPYEPDWSHGVYHLYVVRVQDRDHLIRHLNAAGIGTGIHYPVPLHLQAAYAHLGYRRGDFPVAEAAAASALSLPMFPQLTADQQARVAEQIHNFAYRPVPVLKEKFDMGHTWRSA